MLLGLLGFTGFYWVLLGFTGFYWVLLGFTGFYRVLLGFTGFLGTYGALVGVGRRAGATGRGMCDGGRRRDAAAGR